MNDDANIEQERQRRAEQLDDRMWAIMGGRHALAGGRQVIGHSWAWRDVLRKALQVASTEATVLLQGESGTGKEVVARLIHHASPRAKAPFIAINCAALPDALLESELFGYERGAFTGALLAKPGQLELASGGVLFLDEVTEMTAAAQAKLLRVLQEREFQRLGGTRLLKANVRVITATNRDLREAVDSGAFREDLYYRLNVFDIRMPPLRARRGDIPLLIDAIVQELGRAVPHAPDGVAAEAIDMLVAYDWPGNVRQLRNVLERAAILCDGGLITRAHFDLPVSTSAAPGLKGDVAVLERRTIEEVLRDTGWNKSKAADQLGLTRTQLYGRLRKYELEPPPRVAAR